MPKFELIDLQRGFGRNLLCSHRLHPLLHFVSRHVFLVRRNRPPVSERIDEVAHAIARNISAGAISLAFRSTAFPSRNTSGVSWCIDPRNTYARFRKAAVSLTEQPIDDADNDLHLAGS